MNHVEASLCFPTFPRFCGQTFPEAKDQELGDGLRLRLQRLDGRGVVRRLRRPPDPAVHHPAVGRRRWPPPRSAATPPAACARSASARSRRTSGCRASTPATGTRSSRRATRPAPSCACTSARRRRCRPPRPTRRPRSRRRSASATRWRRCRDFLFSGVLVRFPDLKLAYSEGQIGWMPVHPRAGRRRVGASTGRGAAWPTSSPSRRRPTTTARSTAASSATSTASTVARQGRRRQHHLRDRLPAHRLHLAAHQGGRRRR